MKLAAILSRINALQRGKRFRIAATAVILALASGLLLFLWVKSQEPNIATAIAQRSLERARAVGTDARYASTPLEAGQRLMDSMVISINPTIVRAADGIPVEASFANSGLVVVLAFAATALALIAIVWLGLSLFYLLWLLLGWGTGFLLIYFVPSAAWIGQLLVSGTPLALVFLTGMELLSLALSGPNPIMAVARNVLAEAVRMKVSLVFIVLLLLLLSYIPGALNADQPLRYRVQQWLQYGMGLSYMVLALLTLFLSVATVSFEQRDRVIWQTMTKPVHPLQYLLGKWIGVMALNVVLLGVSAAGVYMFTEYLRHQPANGEIAYHVREDGIPTLGDPTRMVEDRQLLETQVLVARVDHFPEPADVTRSPAKLQRMAEARAQERISQSSDTTEKAKLIAEARGEIIQVWNDALFNAVDSRITEMMDRDLTVQRTPALARQIESEILTMWEGQYRSIPLGAARSYIFNSLPTPEQSNGRPMTLSYTINSGSNNPSDIYRVSFAIGGLRVDRQVALKALQTLVFDSSLVGEDGTLELILYNDPDNGREITFEPDGLQVLVTVGGYETNFIRIVAAMWIKLAFVASVGIALSTFLSFPVACLVSLAILFMAESASYLNDALQHYTSMTKDGIDYFALASRLIAIPVGWIFSVYAELEPTENLVSGRLVSWMSLLRSVVILGGWTLVTLALGWRIFIRRELALYSGR